MSSEIVIPYTSEERPDTGLYNARLGVWLFLASEVMLFGGLFSSYVLLRAGADTWPSGAELLNVPLATFNTVVLIASSVTMVMSWASLQVRNIGRHRLFLGLTILLALVFLAAKGIEYHEHIAKGDLPGSSAFFAMYYTLTGLHGLHVIGGIIVNGWLLGPGRRLWLTDPRRFTNRVEVSGLYWHFVDLVWIFLFPTLYLMPGK